MGVEGKGTSWNSEQEGIDLRDKLRNGPQVGTAEVWEARCTCASCVSLCIRAVQGLGTLPSTSL